MSTTVSTRPARAAAAAAASVAERRGLDEQVGSIRKRDDGDVNTKEEESQHKDKKAKTKDKPKERKPQKDGEIKHWKLRCTAPAGQAKCRFPKIPEGKNPTEATCGFEPSPAHPLDSDCDCPMLRYVQRTSFAALVKADYRRALLDINRPEPEDEEHYFMRELDEHLENAGVIATAYDETIEKTE